MSTIELGPFVGDIDAPATACELVRFGELEEQWFSMQKVLVWWLNGIDLEGLAR